MLFLPEHTDLQFGSDNEWGVPSLNAALQPRAVYLPIRAWGSVARSTHQRGCWHFYVDDYRFQKLAKDPKQLVDSQPIATCEVNFSIFDQMPYALALHRTYVKRWLSCYWQTFGIRIFADLNFPIDLADICMLGIPRGWKMYSTRGYSQEIGRLDEQLAIAREHAGTDDVRLLVCEGGKTKTRTWCARNAPYAIHCRNTNAIQLRHHEQEIDADPRDLRVVQPPDVESA